MKVHTSIFWDQVPGVDYGADTIELARVVPRTGENAGGSKQRSDYVEHVASTGITVEIDVQSVRPLFETLATAAPDLMTRSSETLLEALVRVTDGDVVLAYHRYCPPCGSENLILNNRLGGSERAVVEHLIAIGEPLTDTFKPYLV